MVSKLHLHIDAQRMSQEFRGFAKSIGFADANFAGHPPGFRHFEPLDHMTVKPQTKADYLNVYEAICAKAENGGLVGYVEGEGVISDFKLPEKKYTPNEGSFGISFKRRNLTIEEGFREKEFHLVMDEDKSDSRLIEDLLKFGLYGAYIRKPQHTAIVLTIQGFAKDVDIIAGAVLAYIDQVGGAVNATFQEEKAVNYKVFGIDQSQLPEIAHNLQINGSNREELLGLLYRYRRMTP